MLGKSMSFTVKTIFIIIAVVLSMTLPSIKADGPCLNVPPVAAFTYSPVLPQTLEPIVFDASGSYDVDGFVFSYTWDFDDGNVTVVSAPVYIPVIMHYYTNPGEYNVSLSVMDNRGATNSTAQTVIVRGHVTASFSYFPPDATVRETIAFDASNSTTTEGVIVSYEWDFDDGNKTVVDTPFITHYYTEAKEYAVALNVTDSSGGWDVAHQLVNVTVSEKVAPKAAFTWLPTVPEAGQIVEFNASDSTPDGGEIVSYFWDFGDGTTQTAADPIVTHVFQGFGDYVVLLNVTDDEGLSDDVNRSISVIERPVADFFFTPEEPRMCNVVTLNASISDPRGGSIISFKWTFEDNATVEFGAVVTHQFRRMGECYVSLNVTDSENLWAVKNITINVGPHIADLNEDGVVNIIDISIFAGAYGTFPGHPRWLPRADLDGNNIINILDGVVIARSYNMCIDPFDP